MTRFGKAALCALALGAALPAAAQECFIGEVRMFAGNFAPRGWALTNGQLLPINQNAALFSILGTTYGGDGRTTFALPDLRGRAAAHVGQGPGLPDMRLGERAGAAQVTLNADQMPAHSHAATTTTTINAASARGTTPDPANGVLANAGTTRLYAGAADSALAPGAASSVTQVRSAGRGAAVPTQSPVMGINHIICLFGIFPSRS